MRNYVQENIQNIIPQIANLGGGHIFLRRLSRLGNPPKSIIYCDPPYANTKQYTQMFDSKVFWSWVRRKHSEGHSVYISEYTAPSAFKVIWEKPLRKSIGRNNNRFAPTEKLFTL